MLSREQRKNGDVATYDYNSRGERQGQRYRPQSGEATYRAYATDAQGSVVGLEGPEGQLPPERRYSYDPYGELQPRGPESTDDAEDQLAPAARRNPFRFQGHYYDSAVKSYDMLARHYRPEAARFLSEDRFQAAGADLELQTDPLTQKRYAFAGGNPVSRIEFDGHKAYCPDPRSRRACIRTVGQLRGADKQQIRSAIRDSCSFNPCGPSAGGAGTASAAPLYPVGETPAPVARAEQRFTHDQLAALRIDVRAAARNICEADDAGAGCARRAVARTLYEGSLATGLEEVSSGAGGAVRGIGAAVLQHQLRGLGKQQARSARIGRLGQYRQMRLFDFRLSAEERARLPGVERKAGELSERRARGLRLGKAAARGLSGLAGGFEYFESRSAGEDVGTSIFRGVGRTAGTLGGGAAGAIFCAPAGPVGAAVCGGAGGWFVGSVGADVGEDVYRGVQQVTQPGGPPVLRDRGLLGRLFP